MELVQFHKLRLAVQQNAYPGSNSDLVSVEENLRQTLRSSGFDDVEVETTTDPDGLVIAMCRFPESYTEDEIAARLEQIWEDRVRYQFWEAHSTWIDGEQVEFEGATRTSTVGHYVTIHLVAVKAAIPAQRAPSSDRVAQKA